ncbi:MAG TPA: radical SAM family heme chaperone HemW [Abditibacteriaceae bacterium]|jgi:oxygen-independent coproporphyrinogen-3 oxidase
MLGFYVHIPFCARRCPYCDFAIHVGADVSFRAAYVEALRSEIEIALRKQQTLDTESEISSIFFGGGTPTELEVSDLSGLLNLIGERGKIAEDAEITIEANPENLTLEKLRTLRQAGFNRLSLGAQSFEEKSLKMLGRRHTPHDVETTINQAREAGWRQVSLDLIYAVPGQSRQSWQSTLHQAAQLKLQHISCYALTIESGTPFARRVEKGRLIPVEDDKQADYMSDAHEVLSAAGLARYEVSNYAQAGCESRHNLNYWLGGNYLAVGCGAHGHRVGHRWWNERDTRRYTQMMQETGSARIGEEWLTPEDRWNELVLLGLRLREGLDLNAASQKLNFDAYELLHSSTTWPVLKSEGILREEAGILHLNPAFWSVADAVVARLLS